MIKLKKLLLTGFEPFLDYSLNLTAEIAKQLDGEIIGSWKVEGTVLPVAFSSTWEQCLLQIEKEKPDAVMLLGLAAGRDKITPERVAINCADGDKDNDGIVKQDEHIEKEGPAAYFSTLPIRKFVNALEKDGIPAGISNTAGTYLCNYLMYRVCRHFELAEQKVPAGFIHIPASEELASELGNVPGMPQEQLADAVRKMIGCLD
ncbi:pyroglutamyl-peptidase I [Bacillus sp. FSL H8-0547]